MKLRPPRPFPVIATVLTAACLVLLVGLGIWQIQRLGWKNSLQAQLDTEFSRPADRTLLSAADLRLGTTTDLRRGYVEGRIEPGPSIPLWGQIAEGKPAIYHLLPFRLNSGEILLVVGGYSRTGDFTPRFSGTMRIEGVARLPVWNRFTPNNQPEKNIWYRPDPAAISQARALTPSALPPLFFAEKPVAGSTPLTPVTVSSRLKNDHLSYALFWFTMAGALFGIYLLRFWRSE